MDNENFPPACCSTGDKPGKWFVEHSVPSNQYDVVERIAFTKNRALDYANEALDRGAQDVEISEPRPVVAGVFQQARIIRAFNRQEVIPFLGAGVPLSTRKRDIAWSFDDSCNFLPSSVELARYIAGKCQMPVHYMRDSTNLARVASYYQAIDDDPESLADDLEKIFRRGDPAPIHILLAERCRRPKLIVTTNYDLLTEKAFAAAGRELDRVIHFTSRDNDANYYVWPHGEAEGQFVVKEKLEAMLDPERRTVLYKMHGSVDAPRPATGQGRDFQDNRFVLTEEHYVDFLSRLNREPPVVPPFFTRYFFKSSFLFLGYSLEDWNLRVILHSLGHILPSTGTGAGAVTIDDLRPNLFRHWAIQKAPTPYDSEIWGRRGVTIGQKDLNDFVTALCQNGLLPPNDLPGAGAVNNLETV